MHFEEDKPGHVSVPRAFFMELKEKAKKYDDLVQEKMDEQHPKLATTEGGK
ncbi:MAG: hypothetical protein K6T85_10670 [Gorillibacterium sp.]|nr:hypothetical protein [Gorillibacterium sp.]